MSRVADIAQVFSLTKDTHAGSVSPLGAVFELAWETATDGGGNCTPPKTGPVGARVAQPLEVHQTHISLVALTDKFAYKLKKPVNLGFLDFTTLQKRFIACVDEVELNRRLAPQLYLGIARVRMQANSSSGPLASDVLLAEQVPLTPLGGPLDGSDSLPPSESNNAASCLLTDRELAFYRQSRKASLETRAIDRDSLWQNELRVLERSVSEGFPCVEYAVKMRKIPQECLMSLLMKETLSSDLDAARLRMSVLVASIDAIADILVPFYLAQKSVSDDAIAKFGRLEAVQYNILENFRQIRANEFDKRGIVSGEQLAFLEKTAKSFMSDFRWLFDARVSSSAVCEAHGDLHTGNIFLCPKLIHENWHKPSSQLDLLTERSYADTLQSIGKGGVDVEIFDCIEFNDRLRCHDIACDTSFLAMDLDMKQLEAQSSSEGKAASFLNIDTTSGLSRRLGSLLSTRFMREVAFRMNDPGAMKLHHFYACYRAVVRGKVLSLATNDAMLSDSQRASGAALAKRYFDLACRYASVFDVRDVGFAAPLLVLMCGPTGCGKTFVAKHLARALSLKYISSDDIRNELSSNRAASPPRTATALIAGTQLNAGKYSPESRDVVYNEMRKRAWSHLESIRNESCALASSEDMNAFPVEFQGSKSYTSVETPCPVATHNGCILDATFLCQEKRARAYEVALSCGAVPVVLQVCLTDDAAKARIEYRRVHDPANTSEGTWEVYLHQKQTWESFSCVPLNTDASVLGSATHSRAFNESAIVVSVDASIDRPWETAYDEIVRRCDVDVRRAQYM